MITKTIKVNNRLCDICHSDKQEKLFSHNFVARTKNFDWVFNVNVVICCDCGFVFTSPCATGSDLQKYYADSFAAIKDTNIDYDVHKRLNFIDKYSSSKIKCAKKIILILGECYHEEVLDLLRKDFKKEFLLTDIMRIGDF